MPSVGESLLLEWCSSILPRKDRVLSSSLHFISAIRHSHRWVTLLSQKDLSINTQLLTVLMHVFYRRVICTRLQKHHFTQTCNNTEGTRGTYVAVKHQGSWAPSNQISGQRIRGSYQPQSRWRRTKAGWELVWRYQRSFMFVYEGVDRRTQISLYIFCFCLN